MMEQENKIMSIFDIFASSQETFEEAQQKVKDETPAKRTEYMRLKSDGIYSIRVLPLAPVLDKDGNIVGEFKGGYEIAVRQQMLKIESEGEDGTPKTNFVTVCNAKHVFGDRLPADLIDTYANRACELYSSDTALCEQLRKSSFQKGLRWDYKRCMYVIDIKNEGEGIKVLQLSNSQYRDLNTRRMSAWEKVRSKSKDKNPLCPISSFKGAYPVDIERKKNGGKTEYSFTVDTFSEPYDLSEEVLQSLFDMPRLPEVLYRYTRFHLEATIAFLKQLDEKYDINVVNDSRVQDCIEQIKTLLPADDQSHFTLEGHGSDTASSNLPSIDDLYNRYNDIADAGLGDKSEEGQELRGLIKEFIEDKDLPIKITYTKSNADLLEEIDEVMAEESDNKQVERKKESHKNTQVEDEEDDDESKEEESSSRNQRERNDDTNEPAVRLSRRGARPQRR